MRNARCQDGVRKGKLGDAMRGRNERDVVAAAAVKFEVDKVEREVSEVECKVKHEVSNVVRGRNEHNVVAAAAVQIDVGEVGKVGEVEVDCEVKPEVNKVESKVGEDVRGVSARIRARESVLQRKRFCEESMEPQRRALPHSNGRCCGEEPSAPTAPSARANR